MGTFDTFYGYCKCPNCCKSQKIEIQSKSYLRIMGCYSYGDYINTGTQGSYIHTMIDTWYCENCHNKFNINMIVKNGQVIGFINDKYTISLDCVKTITKGVSHILEYKKQCKEGEGVALEKIELSEHPIKDFITALGHKWIILSVYKEEFNDDNERIEIKSYHRAIYDESYVYKVKHPDFGIRMIRDIQPTVFKKALTVYTEENFKSQYGTELKEVKF